MLTAGQEAPFRAPYCRVTVLAPRATVDVALPADVPVAELVPMMLDLVGEPVFGVRPVPWRLAGAAGAPLPPGASLAELGVPDGELLRLVPDVPPPPPPVFDDPVDALASGAGGAAADGRRFAAAAVLVVAATAAVLLAMGPPGTAVVRAVVATLAAGAAVGLAARSARVEPDAHTHLAGSTAALAAVPFAAAAGWAALPGSSAAAQLLLATAAAGTVAAGAQIALRVVAPALVAVVVAAVPVGLGALVVLRFGSPPSSVAAAVGALAVAAGPLLPRVALRLSGLPRPLVPADSSELIDADRGPDILPPDEFAERSALARGYLAGLAGGCAALAVAGALPAAAAGGWAGPALACVIIAVLGLRARGFADPAPSRTLLGCAVVGLAGLAVLTAAHPEPLPRLVAIGVLLAATGLDLVAIGRSTQAGSPVSRRAIDLVDVVLVAVAVPLALAAMDLFRLVRGL
ncbi:type VII secretion integral membrane protein EccD [Pseudonocardia cypriaca]|uniref:Type VII secretion integral membrane protein EccD n=1 Tax=Pseudonocardia cypriaca TaxID=882449 RepID=A0A543FN36_9PSEU|nr:type VII secretion integral membrane protein EccD [Pseudonocardia cypriaca]TQM35211.1 type VII secretion integral membrane protein EccD [Pseudonocardia cypriaca]